MLAGFAKADITPSVGTDLTGYLARTNPSLGVHDPLYCRAFVLGDGDAQAALIQTDTLGFGLEYTRQVKQCLEAETGIPASNIMLAGTHTHSGPATVFLQDCGEIAISYLAELPEKIVATVRAAQADLSLVEATISKVQVPGVAVNRRDRANGPVDEELTVLGLREPTGAMRAAWLHFTCHAVVLGGDNRLISADFPGAACAAWEHETGVPCLYLQGPCGDINPIRHGGSFIDVEETGAQLAQAAVNAVGQAEAISLEHLAVQSKRLRLPLGPLPSFADLVAFREQQLAGAGEVEDQFKQVQAKVSQAMVHWTERTIASYCSGLLKTEVEVEIQCFELGDQLLIAVPGELFVEFGLEAKRLAAQAGKHALVIAYANGDIGYIPVPSSYGKGGYEVEWAYRYYGYPAPLLPQAGELVWAAIAEFTR
ncbi:MAG: neutral/alkaline non-lysosomal ceramidase N-terminal domain-containing protein [Anaerolineae bacterium]